MQFDYNVLVSRLNEVTKVTDEFEESAYYLFTDNGKEFSNQIVNDFCKEHHIQHRLAQSYKPTTNGLTERMNREIRKKIKAGFIRNNNLEWFSKLQTININTITLIKD